MKHVKHFAFILLFSLNLVNANTPTKIKNENNNTFSKEELSELIDSEISPELQDNKEYKQYIENVKKSALEKLDDYKVTGFSILQATNSFNIDLNIALIWDTQNPAFNVVYKNSNGEIKKRKYQAYIKSIGFKRELTFKFNMVFFLGSDLNYLNTNKKIELGYGIDLGSRFLDITYASFENAPGGMLLIGIPLPLEMTEKGVGPLNIKKNLSDMYHFTFHNKAFGEKRKKDFLNLFKENEATTEKTLYKTFFNLENYVNQDKPYEIIKASAQQQTNKVMKRTKKDGIEKAQSRFYQFVDLGIDLSIVTGGTLEPLN